MKKESNARLLARARAEEVLSLASPAGVERALDYARAKLLRVREALLAEPGPSASAFAAALAEHCHAAAEALYAAPGAPGHAGSYFGNLVFNLEEAESNDAQAGGGCELPALLAKAGHAMLGLTYGAPPEPGALQVAVMKRLNAVAFAWFLPAEWRLVDRQGGRLPDPAALGGAAWRKTLYLLDADGTLGKKLVEAFPPPADM